jgi:transcriptional adapter 2-alpha
MTEPIFTDDWTLDEEIKLLGALSHLGIGNWEDISKILGKGKFECRSHYHAFYYKKQNDYLPNLNSNNIKNKNTINERKKNKSIENQILQNIGKEIGYIPYNIDNNQANRSINISRNNSKSEHSSNKVQLQNACNTLGYWPKRNEFDVEYKNDAEIELMEIDYKEKEDSKEQEKLNEIYDQILIDYNDILEKREERKNFILEKNLYDVKKQFMNEKKLEKEDREIYQSVKQSLKYLTNEQFKEYFEGIILEKNLKSRLNQLLYYYKNGYKTYGKIDKYIYNLKQQGNKIRNKYNIKTNLKNLSISLRESTVKQLDKFDIK